MSNVIEAHDLVKTYGTLNAVDHLDLAVKGGTVFSLLGPNGAGKTTTVEILEGLRKATSGSATVLGSSVSTEYEKVRRKVGILPQDFEPFDRLTPTEAVSYWADMFGRRITKDEIKALLESVGLSERARVQAMRLSGGEKRKLGIAMSLAGAPELLFLDEPTTGLDPKARRDLWGLITGLKREGRTVFLTTHYLDEAERLADEVAIMHHGKVIERGTPQSLVADHGSSSAVVLVGAGKAGLEEARAAGFEAILEGEDVVVAVRGNGGAKEALRRLADLKAPVQEIYTRRQTLEDIFLKLVGAGMEEGVLNE